MSPCCSSDEEKDCGCGGECQCGGECCCGGGCQCRGECGCGCDSGQPRFQRRFKTKAEQIAELEAYLNELQKEVQAVEEKLADLRK
jgi:hypothetical protein